ncbi:hypothetical protein ACIRRA_44240 [Nocardia sp. NPDC101769]|uniref:hypothetical protein n=1 Tax=Nocardia sp. NPDC101769 TaxID=3364333 RepID=UPI0037FEDBEF
MTEETGAPATEDQPVTGEPTVYRWIRKAGAPALPEVVDKDWSPFVDEWLPYEVKYVIDECDGLSSSDTAARLGWHFGSPSYRYRESLESGDLAKHLELIQE